MIRGLNYFLDGFELIGKPGLKRFVIIPALINTAIFIGLFFLAKHYMAEFNAWFDAHVPHWLEWLTAVLWVIFFMSFFIFFIYAFVIFANIVAAPFNSLLSEKVELHLTGKTLERKTLLDFMKDVPQMFLRQLSIIVYYIIGAVFIFILFFIPVIQSIAPFAWFIFNAWFMAITYLDYPTDNHHITIAALRARLRQKPGLALVFGSCVLAASMIPILNFFTIPAAVAGATRLWLKEFENR